MKIERVKILEVPRHELEAVLAVHEAAFGQHDEAELVRRLLDDPTARPCLSLGAYAGDRLVGHILFTRATLPEPDCTAALLAPLAVVPDGQGQGIGGRLIEQGVRRLADAGVALVFVLGWPDYYQRHGFEPVGSRGYEAPYPLLPEQADAWMLRELVDGSVERCKPGTVRCAEALNRPEFWIE
jgi:predicted N-acetyltransferase YhbS